MNRKTVIMIFWLFILACWCVATKEYPETTTDSGEVCELDNSCISNNTVSPENQIERKNVSEKWKYNVSDGVTTLNDTAVHIHNINETNSTIHLEIDEPNANTSYNQSKSKNQTKLTNMKFQIQSSDHCFCDMTKGSCDLNCCCDQDCVYVNRDVFKICNETQKAVEDSFCPSKILNSPLLCVVKDNLFSRHFYPKHQKPFQTLNVEKLLKNRNVFSWSFPSLPIDTSDDSDLRKDLKEYEIGSPILMLTNNSKLKEFRLPKPTLTSRDCENTEPVGFLENYETVCTYHSKNVSKSACEDNSSIFNPAGYYTNFSFVMNPNLTNLSSPLNCDHNCAPIKPFACENEDSDSCKPFNLTLKPTFVKNICQRAVISVHYKITHNGTEGILSAEVFLQIGSVVLVPNLVWSVPFKLTYQWVNQDQYYSLSGYPGYAFGKPIITGYLVVKKRKQNVTLNSIEMSHNHQHWLTYFETDVSGECSKMRRYNILFRENFYAHCFLRIPPIRTFEQCETLQNEIFNIMFGVHTNISNVYASSLGQPDVSDKNKWIPFALNLPVSILNESCNGIITSVKILILHALIGEHDDPQQSIIGVKVVGNVFDRHVLKREKLKISVSVNFYDVTNPPLRIFAEPPTYEVKLPTDFFYPFFSKSPKFVQSYYFVFGLIPVFLMKRT